MGMSLNINLVGGLDHGFYFSIYWEYIYIYNIYI